VGERVPSSADVHFEERFERDRRAAPRSNRFC